MNIWGRPEIFGQIGQWVNARAQGCVAIGACVTRDRLSGLHWWSSGAFRAALVMLELSDGAKNLIKISYMQDKCLNPCDYPVLLSLLLSLLFINVLLFLNGPILSLYTHSAVTPTWPQCQDPSIAMISSSCTSTTIFWQGRTNPTQYKKNINRTSRHIICWYLYQWKNLGKAAKHFSFSRVPPYFSWAQQVSTQHCSVLNTQELWGLELSCHLLQRQPCWSFFIVCSYSLFPPKIMGIDQQKTNLATIQYSCFLIPSLGSALYNRSNDFHGQKATNETGGNDQSEDR